MRIKKLILIISAVFLCTMNIARADLKQLNTQADIINEARKDFAVSEKRLENIYSKINQGFSSDKEFINLLNQDKKNYYQSRMLKRDVVLPHSHTSYGMNNYEVYSPMYLTNLNNQQIHYLKNTVQTYCFYHNDKPYNSCKMENINEIFK